MKKIQSKVVGVHNNKDFVRNDRTKWLREHNSTLNKNNETYQIIEPEELETEGYWEVMSKEVGKVIRY